MTWRWKGNPYYCHWYCQGCRIFKWKFAFDFRRSKEICKQCLDREEKDGNDSEGAVQPATADDNSGG